MASPDLPDQTVAGPVVPRGQVRTALPPVALQERVRKVLRPVAFQKAKKALVPKTDLLEVGH